MSVMDIGAALKAAGAAKDASEGVGALQELYEALKNSSPGNNSLTRAIKSTIITSKVVVDRACADDEILPDVLNTLHKLYAGWVLTAMQLEATDVTSGKKVKSFLSTVATEKVHKLSDIDRMKLISGVESSIAPPVDDEDEQVADNTKKSGTPSKDFAVDKRDLPKNLNLPAGQTLPITLNVNGKSVTIDLLILMAPTIVTSKVFNEYFNLTFPESLKERWFKVRTGEISFFKDFLFEIDKANSLRDAMKADKSGKLAELENDRGNRVVKFLRTYFAGQPTSKNTANAILIMDKRNFDSMCKTKGLSFSRQEVRDKFFGNTLSTAMVVIDNDYQQIDMFYAGIGTVGTYSFKQCKTQSKDDRVDIQSIMKSFYSSMAPRF